MPPAIAPNTAHSTALQPSPPIGFAARNRPGHRLEIEAAAVAERNDGGEAASAPAPLRCSSAIKVSPERLKSCFAS